MEKIKIWVDDVRSAPPHYIHFKTVNDTINYLSTVDPSYIEVLSLDHDAGDYYSQGGDYIRILDWLESMNISIPIAIHSMNIVGINNMQRIIKRNNWEVVSG